MIDEYRHLNQLQSSINFFFKDNSLLIQACTHSSALKKNIAGLTNNERLEFLGDAVLKLLISDYLYEKYSHYDEGELSKLRSYFVSDIFISKLAVVIDLGSYINFSKAEQASGAAERQSILANAMEALIGACYLDQGLTAVKVMFFNLFHKIDIDYSETVDFKSKLQEICQKNKEDLPLYSIVKQEGPDHKKEFHVKAKVSLYGFFVYAMGSASTKKHAEQLAAKQILSDISND